MFPMITSVGEFRRAEAAVRECMAELDAEKAAYNPGIELGVMIETPAAVMVADLLAAEARFFSIGTNDLTQYVMAADRGNPRVAHLCDPFDTAVKRSMIVMARTIPFIFLPPMKYFFSDVVCRLFSALLL